ncbi:MAG: GNAT family N-acetyltransferase [Rhodobacter sp.]|nr:GNAT family N-acetyltransferase [Rhodobacter sp.]
MTAALHLAREDDLERLLPLIEAYHSFEGIVQDAGTRRDAVLPLLSGSPYGAVWLIGPRQAPVGYIVITLGWSVEMGGMDAFVDEFFMRANVRGRGMGSEVLNAMQKQLAESGVKALHLEVGAENPRARALYERCGFRLRDGYHLMTWHADR